VTPLYPQKLTLTSPTGGGRSVGIVRSRTKATEFSFSFTWSLSRLLCYVGSGSNVAVASYVAVSILNTIPEK